MKERYLTITALTKYLKRKIELDPHLRNVWLRGEISNFKLHSRGHMYLTLKDDQSRVQAIMFAGNNKNLPFVPENGMNVLVKGEISVFETYGQYQLYIKEMQPDGIGALYLAFEQLKEKLDKKGYFATANKKEIPKYPKRIAIITSPTGAAVRDILTTIKRRYPIVETTILPVIVQGEYAVDSITNAILMAEKMACFDTIILGRGGGSIEDLWGFNEEKVAEAIYHCSVPIISAVGHETDTTISDFVADLRAPTPTGAAELSVPSQTELKQAILSHKNTLTRFLTNILDSEKRHLNRLQQSYAFKYPQQLINQKEQQLDAMLERMSRAKSLTYEQKREKFSTLQARLQLQQPTERLRVATEKLLDLNNSLVKRMTEHIQTHEKHLIGVMDKLTILNPLEIMKRGFSISYDSKENVMHSIEQVDLNDTVKISLSDGNLNCKVLDKEAKNNE